MTSAERPRTGQVKLTREQASLLNRLAGLPAGLPWWSIDWEEKVLASHLRLHGLARTVPPDGACQADEYMLQITEAGQTMLRSVAHTQTGVANVRNQQPHR